MINVVGLGYIGLPTALMLASHGVEVVGTDYNKDLVATLNAGKTTFKEKGLDDLFQNAVKAGIKFTTEYQKTDTYIISVPTPYDKFSKKVDPCYVIAAIKDVMNVCPQGATVVIESTVSPGTIDKYIRPEIERDGFRIGTNINLVHANYYDLNWKLLPFGEKVFPPKPNVVIEKPKNFEKMITVAEKLSKGIPFVRIDLYNINGVIKFGEMTFFPNGGFGRYEPSDADLEIGNMINLPERKIV